MNTYSGRVEGAVIVMDGAKKSAFEFEGSEHDAKANDSSTVTQKDLQAVLDQPNTRSEKVALAAEKTKGTAKALLDKLANKINSIKSEKVRSAVIWGGAALALIAITAVGILVGRAIYGAWLSDRNTQTTAMIDEMSFESNSLFLEGASEEDKTAFAERVKEKVKELEQRNDENLWRMQVLEASVLYNSGQIQESILSSSRALETAPQLEKLGICESILFAYNTLGDIDGQIQTLEMMIAQDVFTGSRDPLAESARGAYARQLERLKSEAQG